MGRRITIAMLLAGFLSLPAQAAPYQGRIAQVTGAATLNGKPATVGMTVATGDRLRTRAGSKVDLIWRYGTAMRLMPTSEMVVRRWDTEQQISLSFGGLLSVLAKGVRYRTTSPHAVAAVTGTVYYHEESTRLPGYVCVCQGSVGVGIPGATSLSPIVGRHHKAVYVKDAAVHNTRIADGQHTDQDIAELEAYQRQPDDQHH